MNILRMCENQIIAGKMAVLKYAPLFLYTEKIKSSENMSFVKKNNEQK